MKRSRWITRQPSISKSGIEWYCFFFPVLPWWFGMLRVQKIMGSGASPAKLPSLKPTEPLKIDVGKMGNPIFKWGYWGYPPTNKPSGLKHPFFDAQERQLEIEDLLDRNEELEVEGSRWVPLHGQQQPCRSCNFCPLQNQAEKRNPGKGEISRLLDMVVSKNSWESGKILFPKKMSWGKWAVTLWFFRPD